MPCSFRPWRQMGTHEGGGGRGGRCRMRRRGKQTGAGRNDSKMREKFRGCSLGKVTHPVIVSGRLVCDAARVDSGRRVHHSEAVLELRPGVVSGVRAAIGNGSPGTTGVGKVAPACVKHSSRTTAVTHNNGTAAAQQPYPPKTLSKSGKNPASAMHRTVAVGFRPAIKAAIASQWRYTARPPALHPAITTSVGVWQR